LSVVRQLAQAVLTLSLLGWVAWLLQGRPPRPPPRLVDASKLEGI
jgi:hypothetical protein